MSDATSHLGTGVIAEAVIGDGDSARRQHRSHLRRIPRWLRRTLAVAVALAVSLVFGITTARAQLYLGPHQTTYRITTDSTITADFGPLGTLRLDSPAGPLGVRASVGEIPTGLTSQDHTSHDAAAAPTSPLAGLTKDLGAYVSFFSNPAATIDEVVHALAFDAIRRTLLALAALLSLGGALYAVLGPKRRADLIDEIGPATAGLGATLTAAAVVTALIAQGGAAADDTVTLAAKAFEDTPLAGARVTGQVAAVLDNYGAQAIDIYQDNEKFYDGARKNLAAAWTKRLQSDAEEPARPRHDDAVSFLLISDLHCNVSMAEMIMDTAKAANVVAILNIGDTSMNGTAVEKYCVDALNRARPNSLPMYVIDGNHDSPEIGAAEVSHGQQLLAGEVVEVAGVRILGASSPAGTRPGAGLVADKEWITSLGRDLRDTACADGDVDLLMVHEPQTGDAAMHSGCVPMQISGHTHKRYEPFQVGQGIRYVNASTAGAKTGKLTVGPLNGTAEMTVLRFDPSERRFIDWRLVEVHPNGKAEVGPVVPIPAPVGAATSITPPAHFDVPSPTLERPRLDSPELPATGGTDGPVADPIELL